MSYHSRQMCIVEMRFSGAVSVAEFIQWFDQLEHLLQSKQYFVLLMQTAPNTTFPDEYRQLQAVWYKKNKSQFFQYCQGLARIAQDEEDQQRLNTPALHAAWQVPYFVSTAYADALHWVTQRWLKHET